MMGLQPVLVTGAGGFIGGHLVLRLIAQGRRVWCLVRDPARVEHLRLSGALLLTGDVTDRSSVDGALDQSRALTVFHLAGVVKTFRRREFARVNAGGVETVAQACARRADSPVLIVVSSLSAVGPSTAGPLRDESAEPAPVSSYGRSKLAGESAAARYAGAVPVSIVRPPIVLGPGDRAVLEMIRPIARWGVHVVPGRQGGNLHISLIHVEDLVEGLLLVGARGERLGANGSVGQGIYFLATDENPTHVGFGQAVASALGRKPPAHLRVPGPLLKLAGMSGDLMARLSGKTGWINSDKMTEALAGSWTCSSAKARVQLGWSPARSLTDRLRETVQWYREAGWLGSAFSGPPISAHDPNPPRMLS